MREHAASVLTVLAPAQGVAASASADHPAATLEAIRALSAQCLGAAQRAADMMARRVWVACTIASQYLDLEPPPQLVVDSTSALPAFATAHATLLEQLLSVLRTALGSRGRPVSEDARADAAAGAPAMGLIAPHTDLSVEISRRGQTTHMPRAQSNPPHDQKQDARHESSARKSEARREEYVEARKRSQMLAMESFAKISYSGSQFGELRSCLDTAPTARPASADAAKMQSRSVAAWPGTRPASSLAAVASLCDVVYSSAADTLKPPPPNFASFESAPLRAMSASASALAIPVAARKPRRDGGDCSGPAGGATTSTPFLRRQATGQQPQPQNSLPQRKRPASAAGQLRKPWTGAVSTPLFLGASTEQDARAPPALLADCAGSAVVVAKRRPQSASSASVAQSRSAIGGLSLTTAKPARAAAAAFT